MNEKLSILIADDHKLIREAVSAHVSALGPDVEVLEVGSYDEVLALGSAENRPKPNIVLLDLNMPGLRSDDKFSGLRQVCAVMPDTAVVIFSGDTSSATIAAALKNGAQGYIPKTTYGPSLISALKLVLDGEIYVPPAIMADHISENSPAAPVSNTALSNLTSREMTALRLLVKGLTNKEIGQQLDLQEVTVKMHLRNAYRKIGASNRIDAVRIAVEKGLV